MGGRARAKRGSRTAGREGRKGVLAGNAKLGGIRGGLSGEDGGPCAAITGVGMNIRLPDSVGERAGQPVTDLADRTGGQPPDAMWEGDAASGGAADDRPPQQHDRGDCGLCRLCQPGAVQPRLQAAFRADRIGGGEVGTPSPR